MYSPRLLGRALTMFRLLTDLWQMIAGIVLVLTLLFTILMLLGVVEPVLPP